MLRRDLNAASVGLSGEDEGEVEWLIEKLDGKKVAILQVKKAPLREVSLVAWPALKGARVTPMVDGKPQSVFSATKPGNVAAVAEMRRLLAAGERRNRITTKPRTMTAAEAASELIGSIGAAL